MQMLLPLQRASWSKTAEVGTVMALVAGQECWSIGKCISAHCVCSRTESRKLLAGDIVSRHVLKDVKITKLLVKVFKPMQEQQAILPALSNLNGILHERCRNPLMTEIWVRHNTIDTLARSRAGPRH
jgi:hypothetical protein